MRNRKRSHPTETGLLTTAGRRPARKPKSAFFRAIVSSMLAVIVAVAVQVVLLAVVHVDVDDTYRLMVTSYVIAWPLYTALYVGWGLRVYSRLDRDPALLRSLSVDDDQGEQRPLQRILGATGATNITISAALVAMVVTVVIAQRPEFRSEPVYIALALLTVASSWVLMVFSYAQSYMRLGVVAEKDAHMRFAFPDPARFTDYVTLAVLMSVMAATVSAEFTSRRAWRVARTNVIIAFVFNSVIIAMMVSLLFGGFLN